MKKVSKETKIITALLLLVLSVLSIFNVTYSYFSATANSKGELKFAKLDVRFAYRTSDSLNYSIVGDATPNPMVLVPAVTTSLQRGDEFEYSITTNDGVLLPAEHGGIYIIHNPNIEEENIDCYVRFWIDAFEIKQGEELGTENYGRYFLFPVSSYYTNENSSSENSWCYYSIPTLSNKSAGPGYVDNVNLGKKLQIDPEAPAEILQKTFKLTLNFEAIQVQNNAFLSESGFNDEKGYYLGWG